MIQIRYTSFETNSSSVHVLVIPKDTNIHIPKSVHLYGGEWGWSGSDEYDTLNYFYEACVHRGPEEVQLFIDYLKRKGVEEIHCKEIEWEEEKWYDGTIHKYAKDWDGYIDHSTELPLNDLFANENLLDRFLFGDDSFIEIGNDNSDECPDEMAYDPNKYDTIRKGN